MPFNIVEEHFGGAVKVIEAVAFGDDRGFFLESYREDMFEEMGVYGPFLQDNHSRSAKGVVRGLHFQYDKPMAKLMRVTLGSAYVMAVDIRKGSPTLGESLGVEISTENRLMVWAPPSFARGFCATSDYAEVQYKCTAIYNPATESGILWNDPKLGIDWPTENPVLSEKDEVAQTLDEWLARPESDLFQYSE